jgi:hypothetical protein
LLSPEEVGNKAISEWRDAVYMVNADGSGLRLEDDFESF